MDKKILSTAFALGIWTTLLVLVAIKAIDNFNKNIVINLKRLDEIVDGNR